MSRVEMLKAKIEEERRILDEMVDNREMEDVLTQSRKLDSLMEEYIRLTN